MKCDKNEKSDNEIEKKMEQQQRSTTKKYWRHFFRWYMFNVRVSLCIRMDYRIFHIILRLCFVSVIYAHLIEMSPTWSTRCVCVCVGLWVYVNSWQRTWPHLRKIKCKTLDLLKPISTNERMGCWWFPLRMGNVLWRKWGEYIYFIEWPNNWVKYWAHRFQFSS